jgi:hypothetical protein
MSQVTNLAFFRARRGHSEALGTAVAALVEPTRLEAGCLNYCRAVLKSLLPHFRCTLETVAQRQTVEHTGVASINPRTAELEKRDRPNGL